MSTQIKLLASYFGFIKFFVSTNVFVEHFVKPTLHNIKILLSLYSVYPFVCPSLVSSDVKLYFIFQVSNVLSYSKRTV